ncbi:putative phosphate-non-repressible acid phosphatase precursor [Triangularia setosa]|uniref:Phosphate-non-repressible acid phosphatase n=1 Tax=Triangularia setosa TaxID=2587417 RepID=A0AAN6W440_9PEZI|nr:putative phosphate-non-repressible acid phosphatase precursor [Podospora setosa]
MASYNGMPAMSSGATGPDALGQQAQPSLGIDGFDPNSMAFDDPLLHSLPFTPTAAYDFDTFSTTFEDPFSYPARPFGNDSNNTALIGNLGGLGVDPESCYNGNHGGAEGSSSPQELDNKLLGFGTVIPGKATLIEPLGHFIEPIMSAELYGMFFVAEDVFGADNGGDNRRPMELTCYRRNLWQCSGQITLPRQVAQFAMTDGQQQIPVLELAASITALESIEGKQTEIISIPWKSNNPALGGVTEESTKSAGAPAVTVLDLGSGQEIDGTNRVTVGVSWKRLQFKHATANNGRRKGLQQHYVVQINLLVKGKGGEYVKVAEVQSGPVIVRGRSPRNFDSRKDVPLSGDRRLLERKSVEGLGSASASLKQQQQQLGTPQSQPLNQDFGQSFLQRHQGMGSLQPTADWSTPRPFLSPNPQQQHASKKLALSSPSLNRPPVPPWDLIDPSLATGITNNKPPQHNNSLRKPIRGLQQGSQPNNLPINLSLSEDERSPPNLNRSNSSGGESSQSPQQHFSMSSSSKAGSSSRPGLPHKGQSTQSAGQQLNSPQDQAEVDMLYEYFPLSVDDWMPPVDAIYRPHVVHHTIVPPEVKAQQLRSKGKRYFAAD